MTKIFCDIADIKIIRKFNKKKIVKGFTTNPTLMRKAGAKDYADYTKKILKTTIKPVSCEVFADDINNMIIQGKKISKWGKNVFVKVPVTNSRGQFMGKVIKNLNKSKIKLNITAVYTSKQTKEILKKINKKTKVIISIFAAPASMEFSTSSLTTLAGRSITSPAAILFIRPSGNRLIRGSLEALGIISFAVILIRSSSLKIFTHYI